MALNVVTHQMSFTLEYVVTKRQSNFDYLKRTHQGRTLWLNVVHLSKQQILQYYDPQKLPTRTRRWFLLGLSCGKLLELTAGVTVVRALSQLIEEYEHFIKNEKEKRSLGFDSHYSRPSTHHPSAAAAATIGSGDDPIAPRIHKIGKQVVYHYLQTPSTCIAGSMDYCEVVFSLCDILSLVYSKLLDPSCHAPVVHEAILKIDKKIKQLVIAKMSQDLTNIATPLFKHEFKGLLNNMFLDESRPSKRGFITLDDARTASTSISTGTSISSSTTASTGISTTNTSMPISTTNDDSPEQEQGES